MNNTVDFSTKSITFVTGTRADFGKIKPIAERLVAAGASINFFVTGMHMLEQYGSTFVEVRRVEGALTHEYINQREGDPLDLIFSKTVLGFSDWLAEHSPDLVVVHGDRVEATAAAFVCATNYVRCLHIEGGEVSGTIDEVFRHCVSKLAHHHFVCSKRAEHNLKSLGETSDRIILIGSPELDTHGLKPNFTLEQVKNHYNIPFDDYGIIVFHPVTSEIETIGEQATNLFSSMATSGRNFVVIAANNDPGSDQIMSVVNSLPSDRFKLIPSMRFEYFSILMRHAGLIIGNSSAGVREAPFLGVPSVNVGSRQSGRAVSQSITHVQASDKDELLSAVAENWHKRFERSTEFGTGDSVNLFMSELSQTQFWEVPLQKHFQAI